MSEGCFITFEGIEGVGKSTQCLQAVDWLKSLGHTVVHTREPGGTEIEEIIRSIFIANHAEPMDAMTELLLVFAARAQHLAQKIQPALAAGHWVVCDRFTDASFAYQGARDTLPSNAVEQLEQLVHRHLQPDITFLLDMPVEAGMARVRSRGEQSDRIEDESLAFFQAVRQGYLRRADQYPDRIRVVDASGSIDTVFARIQQSLQEQWECLAHG